jgi:ABC-2 type transport system permease protein
VLRHISRNEWRGLAADRTLWAVGALLATVLFFGAFNGARWSALQADRQANLMAEQQERIADTRAELLKSPAPGTARRGFSDPRNPARVGQTLAASYAVLPRAPLAPLSVGQSDLLPGYYKVTLATREALFAGDELENPANLLTGSFDVAFVIVFLYPLVILALSYNLLSGEKENGTLALTLSQPVSLAQLAAAKIFVRGAVAFGLTCAFTLLGVLGAGVDLGSPGAATALAAFFGVTAVYGLFWFSLALLVNAFGRGSATNAMVLAGAWLTLALVIPSTVALVATTLYPVPSRVEMIQAVRLATQDASARGAQLLGAYFADHPELAPDGEIDFGDYYSRKFVVEEEVAKQVAPLSGRFEAQIRGQQAVVSNLQYLSPAVLTQQSLNDLAGTGYARFAHFQSEAERFASVWRAHFLPQVYQRADFTAEGLDKLPRFVYQAEPEDIVTSRVGGASLLILFIAVCLLGRSIFALRRYPVAG